MINNQYRKLGRVDQGTEILRNLRKVFFPVVSDENKLTKQDSGGKFQRKKTND